MSVLDRPLTYDDLRQMPDDGQRYEIIDGRLVVSPAPTLEHQDLVVRLCALFLAFIMPRRLGKIYTAPADVRISPENTVQPDIFFVSRERLHLRRHGVLEGAPDLVVEVLSPSTHIYDEVRKADLYARAGVREFWLVDPDDQTIRIYTLVEDRYEFVPHEGTTVRSVILPGFAVDLVTLFAEEE
jgi:Uma2 family endonuclease